MRKHAALCMLILAACAESPEPPAAAPDSAAPAPAAAAPDTSPQSPPDLIDPSVAADTIDDPQRFIAFGLRRLGRNEAEITAVLGTPDSITYEPVQNRHMPEQTDSIVRVYYRTGEATLYRTNGGDLVAGLMVTDNAHLRLPGPRIGMSRDELLAFMGTPESEEDGELHWSCRVCVVDQQLFVRLDNDRVRAIGFAYYAD